MCSGLPAGIAWVLMATGAATLCALFGLAVLAATAALFEFLRGLKWFR